MITSIDHYFHIRVTPFLVKPVRESENHCDRERKFFWGKQEVGVEATIDICKYIHEHINESNIRREKQ
jgi:hypothetical protein